MSIHVDVDWDLCIGSGTCVRLAPGAFALDEEEISVVVDPDAADIGKLRLAADACPTEAIRIGEPRSDARG
jgi:ferredoxin